jgi:hypothetical protein
MSSGTDRPTRYEGYSDFSHVSRSVASAVDDAVEAYALIQSHHSEGARVTPQTAAEAAAHILGAALKLKPELENDLDDETYHEILDRWEGDDGYIERLKQTSLSSRCPEWLGHLVHDIRTAGFELGYLQAGRTVKTEPDDPVEADTEAMFDNL